MRACCFFFFVYPWFFPCKPRDFIADSINQKHKQEKRKMLNVKIMPQIDFPKKAFSTYFYLQSSIIFMLCWARINVHYHRNSYARNAIRRVAEKKDREKEKKRNREENSRQLNLIRSISVYSWDFVPQHKTTPSTRLVPFYEHHSFIRKSNEPPLYLLIW